MASTETGRVYKMYKLDDQIVLRRSGENDRYVAMDSVAIRENTYDRYFWFSADDYFEQGSDVEVIDVKDGVWYVRNKTWDPSIFAKLPDRIVDRFQISDTRIQCLDMYIFVRDGRETNVKDSTLFMEIDGKYAIAPNSRVRITNGEDMQPNLWYACIVECAGGENAMYEVEVVYDKVPTLRDFLYATVD